jgi:hypothetical protein
MGAMAEWDMGRGRPMVIYTLEKAIDMTYDRMACYAVVIDSTKWQRGLCSEHEEGRIVNGRQVGVARHDASSRAVPYARCPSDGRAVAAQCETGGFVDRAAGVSAGAVVDLDGVGGALDVVGDGDLFGGGLRHGVRDSAADEEPGAQSCPKFAPCWPSHRLAPTPGVSSQNAFGKRTAPALSAKQQAANIQVVVALATELAKCASPPSRVAVQPSKTKRGSERLVLAKSNGQRGDVGAVADDNTAWRGLKTRIVTQLV